MNLNHEPSTVTQQYKSLECSTNFHTVILEISKGQNLQFVRQILNKFNTNPFVFLLLRNNIDFITIVKD